MLWARDFLHEEGKYFTRDGRGPGPGSPQMDAMQFGRQRQQDEEPKRFSADLDWMPHVVLVAKTVFVWLDQLSKKYRRAIDRLDQIPDEELDLLASRGFTGLWLIGLFERSRASKKVKQMRGDADAVASAYSLMKYDIADELGGYPAYESLKQRAWSRGLRLAADMVPNHVGIDAEWVVNHPDWFIQTSQPPFPGYRFGGADLSDDPRVGVFIEEGYWSKTDAAVVFVATIARPTRTASSTTATTAPACRGTTPRSSTTRRRRSATRSSRPSSTSRACSRSSASTRR